MSSWAPIQHRRLLRTRLRCRRGPSTVVRPGDVHRSAAAARRRPVARRWWPTSVAGAGRHVSRLTAPRSDPDRLTTPRLPQTSCSSSCEEPAAVEAPVHGQASNTSRVNQSSTPGPLAPHRRTAPHRGGNRDSSSPASTPASPPSSASRPTSSATAPPSSRPPAKAASSPPKPSSPVRKAALRARLRPPRTHQGRTGQQRCAVPR